MKQNPLSNSIKKMVKTLSWAEITSLKQKCSSALIVDLRSEKEFERGHVPGATNIPLLTTAERHEVGTTYKKKGKNDAICLGFSLFIKKIRCFLSNFHETSHTDNGEIRTLILHCARGGMRSSLTAGFLKSLGYDVILAKGGYKTYRTLVLETLEGPLAKHRLLVLHGHTGSGKTELIEELEKDKKIGILNLEKLARHSGSAFGAFNQEGPSHTQMQFENNLFSAYEKVRHFSYLVLEIESTLGSAKILPKFRKSITSSPMILLKKDHKKRVLSLVKDYTSKWNDKKQISFEQKLFLLKPKFSSELFQKLESFAKAKDFKQLIDILLKEHYDPRYNKSLKRYRKSIIAHFCVTTEKKEMICFIKNYVNQANSAILLRA